jgi:drug/metabolite transporter (DMT)-like permease
MSLIYKKQWNKATLQRLSKRDWISLTVVGILAGALAPGLIFQALALTKVNNVILIGRIEPPLTLALSVWLLKERISIWQFMGAIAAFIGVILTIVLQPPQTSMISMGGLQLGLGELLVALGSVAVAISTIISKKYFSQIPLGVSSIFRTGLGTIIFFFTALILYGRDHFADIFSPFLWKWMFLYGGLIVVIGQSFWNKGLQNSTVSKASLIGSFTPIVGIIAAYFILGEVPTVAQYIGASLMVASIFLIRIEKVSQKPRKKAVLSEITSAQAEKEVEVGMGFKGI